MTLRITSSDIARAARVSQTTVSFVLNNTEGASISAGTRARVLSAARALGYVPNSAARTLVSGRSRTLGLVLAHGDLMSFDAFVPPLMFAISRVCNDLGYKLLVDAVEPGAKRDAYFDLTRSKSIDALIVLNSSSEDEALVRLIESNFPVILFGSIGHPNENSICTNSWKAAVCATQHLINLGHRRIAHITYAPVQYVGSTERLRAYQRALDRAKIGRDERLVAYGDFSMESGYHAMQEILRRGKPPTALFAGNDTIAVGAISALREAGLSIPCDVAVVGFDDLPIAAYSHPRLTTVTTQAVVQGEQAALAAIELLKGKRIGRRDCNLALELIVRDSCGASLHRSSAAADERCRL
ncbi:MAG TPA: LacI family DNA-binding transcriptional regulator [Chthoniobacterales bacterium]|nr:LacI family DNA-binding transcriptional regulator [Chthoniobacterales bacterium]